MADPTPARPWWAAIIDRVITGIIGLAVMILAVTVIRGAGAPLEIWLALAIGGAVVAGVAPSVIGRTPPPPDQRGGALVDLIVAVVAIGLIGAGAFLMSGCALLERRIVRCATTPRTVVEDLPDGRCAVRGFCDGHEMQTQIGPGPCGEVEEVAPDPSTPPEPAPEP
jgi:hypothetical protein